MRTSGPRLSSDVAAGWAKSPHQWESNYLNERGEKSDTINNHTACTAPAVRSRWGNPSNRKVADIYRRPRLDIGNTPDEQRRMRATNSRLRECSTLV